MLGAVGSIKERFGSKIALKWGLHKTDMNDMNDMNDVNDMNDMNDMNGCWSFFVECHVLLHA